MAALLPTPSSAGPRWQTDTWPTATASHCSKDLSPVSTLSHRGRGGEGRACVWVSSPLFSSLFSKCLFALWFLRFLCFLFSTPPCLLLELGPAHHMLSPLLSLLPSFASPLLSPPCLSPYLTPCANPVVCSVLVSARPDRTDGSLLRQRSPWAPTPPPPPPGAAQVSRWKVRGARRGRRAWA